MAPLNPTSNKCYSVNCPTDHQDDRLNLKVRTGAATCIDQSRLYTHGGLTIGLSIQNASLSEIEAALSEELGRTKRDTTNLSKYISPELFELDIMERIWTRLRPKKDTDRQSEAVPSPRLYHSLISEGGYVYLYGGLIIGNDNKLEPVCDLWRFDIYKQTWSCLCSGSGKNKGRFGHTMMYLESSATIVKSNHPGLLITGGRTVKDNSVHEFDFYDLVEKKWITDAKKILPIEELRVFLPNKTQKTQKKILATSNTDSSLTIYSSSTPDGENSKTRLIAYTKLGKEAPDTNPLIELSLDMKTASKRLPTTVDLYNKGAAIPYRLNYPNIGYFGDHLIVMGFTNNDHRISIYLYHVPSGRWSTLRACCDHESFSHKITRGYVWASHHRVLLLGDAKMHNSAPSIQYFSHFMTVALPFVNVSGNALYYTSEGSETPNTAQVQSLPSSANLSKEPTFKEYSRYVAPQVQMTSVKSVFPPYAVTLGRNAFDRFGDSLSDFEFVSADGESVPVPSQLCKKRWGRCYEMLIAKGYVRAVDNFERNNPNDEYLSSEKQEQEARDTDIEDESVRATKAALAAASLEGDEMLFEHEARESSPQFRLPFQDKDNLDSLKQKARAMSPLLSPSTGDTSRKLSTTSTSSLSETPTGGPALPAQKPQPVEPAPSLPKAKFPPLRAASSTSSPRGSISGGLQPFSALERRDENQQMESSPNRRLSSHPSSKGSSASVVSHAQGSTAGRDDYSNMTNSRSAGSVAANSLVSNRVSTKFVEQQLDVNSSKIEALLLPRVIYLPFTTTTVKAFAEFLATGQVASKMAIVPTTLDVLLLSKFYELPLLYDLILEILYAIIGNKENAIIADAEELSRQYIRVMRESEKGTNKEASSTISPPPIPCLDGFAEFLTKFNNGILDLKIMKRISRNRNASVDSGRKKSHDSGSSMASGIKMTSSGSIPVILPEQQQQPSAKTIAHNQQQQQQQQHIEEEEIEEGDPRYKSPSDPIVENDGEDEEGKQGHNESSDNDSTSSDGIGVGIGLVSRSSEAQKESLSVKKSSDSGVGGFPGSISMKHPSQSSYSGSRISQFDSTTDDQWPTLGQLAAINAPACTDTILDFIYEMGALAADMKLMVRAANTLDISQKYEIEKKEILKIMEAHGSEKSLSSGTTATNTPMAASASSSNISRAPPISVSSTSSLPLSSGKSRTLFGKFDLGGSTVGGRYEKRGSITSMLSSADSTNSQDMVAGSTLSSSSTAALAASGGANPVGTGRQQQPLNSQQQQQQQQHLSSPSANSLERSDTRDSAKSVPLLARGNSSSRQETIRENDQQQQQKLKSDNSSGNLHTHTISPTQSVHSTDGGTKSASSTSIPKFPNIFAKKK